MNLTIDEISLAAGFGSVLCRKFCCCRETTTKHGDADSNAFTEHPIRMFEFGEKSPPEEETESGDSKEHVGNCFQR